MRNPHEEKNSLCKIACSLMSIGLASMACGAVYVDVNSDAQSPDGSEGAPFKTIQEGVNAVTVAGDEVLVAPGEYPLESTLSVTGSKKMHIRATGANPRDTVVYAVNGDIRCLTMSNGSLFSGFTVSNGFHATQGGGVNITGQSCISNCIVTCCRVESSSDTVMGGGIYVSGGYLTDSGVMVVDSIIDNCRAVQNSTGSAHAYGGGIYNYQWSAIQRTTITNCHALANASSSSNARGGGLYAVGGQNSSEKEVFTAERCRLVGCTASNTVSTAKGLGGGAYYNTELLSPTNNFVDSLASCCSASGNGGGIWCKRTIVLGSTFRDNASGGDGGGLHHEGNGLISGSVLEGNSAANGGGANLVGGVALSNSVVRANTASTHGGGVKQSGTTHVGKCLFARNSAGGDGGGFYNGGLPASEVADSTFAGNAAVGDGAAIYAWHQYALKDTGLVVRNLLVCSNIGKSAVLLSPGQGGDNGTAEIHMDKCTLANNTCTNTAVSLPYRNYSYSAGRMIIRNTLFAGNTSTATPGAPDLQSQIVAANVTYSFLPTGTAAFENAEYHNIVGVADPCFADAANGDYRLKSKSPCREVGYVDDWMNSATDHGTGRVVETVVGTYGVSLAYEKEQPLVVDAKTNIGCFGAFSGAGLSIFVR